MWRLAPAVVIAFVIWAPVSSAGAAGSSPGSLPGADQYRESVPTAGGPRTPNGGGRGYKLPTRVRSLLQSQGGASSVLLDRIATAPGYGAPTGGGKRTRGGRPGATDRAPSSSPFHLLSTSVNAVAGADNGRVIALLAAIVAITAAALLTVRRRQASGAQ